MPALRLRSLIPTVGITAGAIVYTRETGFTNNAAPVAETQPKPQSDLTYQNITAPVETIAHYTKVSKQTYEDLPQLASAVETRLINGLVAKEEYQLLKGDGVAPNLQGFMGIATPAAVPPANSTLIDRLRLAAGQLEAAGWQPSGCVVNSSDWTAAT